MSSYSDRVVSNGATWYARLGEATGATTAVDAIGGQNGAISGAVTLAQPGGLQGDSDKAMTWDGTTGTISVGSVAALNFGTGSFTIEVWISPVAATGARNVLSKGADVTANAGWRIGRPGNGTTAQMSITDGVTAVTLAPTITVGAWTHVVMVIDRTAQLMRPYINGVAGTTADVSLVGTVTNATALTIGGTVGALSAHSGGIDEVATYAVALTAAQVLSALLLGRNNDLTTELGPEVLALRDAKAVAQPTQVLDSTTLFTAEVARIRALDTVSTKQDTNTVLAANWDGLR